MRVLAVIPARGGSRGLPRKNVLPCAGLPLIRWSIDSARDARLVTGIVVSSDDAEILAVAAEAGCATVTRPAELATDTAMLEMALRHAVRNVKDRPDVVVSLQPTCPVRRPGLIDECIRRLYDTDADSVFTARPLTNVWWREDGSAWADYADWRTNNPNRLQRQQLPPGALRWEQDGSVVVTRVFLIDSGDSASTRPPRRIGGRTQPHPNEATPDIDSAEDLAAAEARLLYRARLGTTCGDNTAA